MARIENSKTIRRFRRLMEGFGVVREFIVHWGDMDALGHVNNTRHLRWMETVRVDLFHKIELRTGGSKAHGPILANLSVDYHKPIHYPDTVSVGTRVASLGNSSFKLENVVRDGAGDLCATGECTIVLYDFESQRSVKLSDELRSALEEFQ